MKNYPSLKSSSSPLPEAQKKVFGAPLHTLYSSVLEVTKTSSVELIARLAKLLETKGLNYHPRTIKRQLSGKIHYVPEVLEQALVLWTKQQLMKAAQSEKPELNKLKLSYTKILKKFEEDKRKLTESTDTNLYISPEFFLKMARGYVILKKQTSQRQLAILLQDSLQQQGQTMGLETIQTAFAGKTKKIRKILEDTMMKFFVEAGFTNKAAVEKHLNELNVNDLLPTDSVKIGKLPQKVEAYRIHLGLRSKRQLALQIQKELNLQGYQFHLSSLQSVLEGKTRRTKSVVLQTIEALIKKASPIKNITLNVSDSAQKQHRYVDATIIPNLVENLLKKHAFVTRRQLALLLKQELQERNFNFSLNSLQFILAGKTKRTRGIIIDLLNDYLQEDKFQEIWKQHKPELMGKKGRPSLEKRLLEAYSFLQQANSGDATELNDHKEQFLTIREILIQKRWEKNFQKHHPRRRSTYRNQRPIWQSNDNYSRENNDGYTLWDSSIKVENTKNWERLVS